jgi:hypothetical protein
VIGMAGVAVLALPLCTTVLASPEAPRYGLRHDPQAFVATSEGLEAALVRTQLLRHPKQGDAECIEAAVARLLQQQKPDGGFGEGPVPERLSATNDALQSLVDMGVTPDRPEMARLLGWVRAVPGESWGIYFSGALCRMGLTDFPGLSTALRLVVDHPEKWFATGCPWTPVMVAEALWFAREVPGVDTMPLLEKTLRWAVDNMSEAGCLSYWEPWGFVRCAGLVEHPLTEKLIDREVAMLLRAQRPDGGWGGHSVEAFRVLLRGNRLAALGELPPLPPDWHTARSIPAPKGDLWTLAWGEGLLWTRDGATDEIVAVDPADGREVRRWRLPEGRTESIGWGEGSLLVLQSQPKRVLRLHPTTGAIREEMDVGFMSAPCAIDEVGGRLWLTDGYLFPGWSLDPHKPCVLAEGADPFSLPRLEPHLAGPLPLDLAAAGDGVWHREYWAPLLLKSGPHGKLLAWGELPFGGGTGGIAWDGEHLWALDGPGGRIAVIERDAE